MKRLAALVLLLSAAACAGSPADGATNATAARSRPPVFGEAPPGALQAPANEEASPPGGFELRMSRGACFGICPAYRLVIHADGGVDFIGAAHTATAGAQHGEADAAALAQLRSRLMDPEFAPWGSYVRGKPGCGPWATDMPGVSIQAYVDGRWRRIDHDLGCRDAPPALKQLEQAIDAAAGSERWVSGRSVR